MTTSVNARTNTTTTLMNTEQICLKTKELV
jgi:hypothetical protein